MPRNSTGTCTVEEAPFVPNTTIVSADTNSNNDDFASMLTDSLSRSGKGGMNAALDMNSHKINEVADAVAGTDAPNLAQVQTLVSTGSAWAIAAGTANAITATYSPAITLTDGQIAFFRASLANTSTTVTFSPNGLTARNIVKYGGTALNVNDILGNAEYMLRYNLANTRWELMDPAISLNNLGAIAGNVVDKTANYALANADKGKTFSFSGASLFTVTVGAAAGFDLDFQCRFVNMDSRGKAMAINGITNFVFYPGQSFTLINANGVWVRLGYNARYQASNATFNVNSSTGSDASDGLGTGAGAFATIQFACNFIRKNFDPLGTSTTIQLATGTYTENITTAAQPLGAHVIIIKGDTASPSSYIITASAASTVFTVDDYSTIIFQGVTFTRTGAGSVGVRALQFSIADFDSCVFASFDSGVMVAVASKSRCNFTGANTIDGNAVSFLQVTQGGAVEMGGVAYSMPNPLAFTSFIACNGAGSSVYIDPGATFTGAGSAGGSTGLQWDFQLNAVLQRNGATVPCATGGTNTTGAQIA